MSAQYEMYPHPESTIQYYGVLRQFLGDSQVLLSRYTLHCLSLVND